MGGGLNFSHSLGKCEAKIIMFFKVKTVIPLPLPPP